MCFKTTKGQFSVAGPMCLGYGLCWAHGTIFGGGLDPPSRGMAIFTARWYASAVLAMALSVSVTSRSSTKTAKRGITQTTPHDSPGTLVF